MGALAALSVDLDEIREYFAIHGVAGTPPPLVYEVALGRIESFARAHDVPLTLFAVGRDVEHRGAAAALRALADAGHEIDNHSFGHRYDLTRLSTDEIRREIEEGARAIELAVGRRPAGFRAPGYTVTDAVFDALDDAGVVFDSSVFPSGPYWLAKAAALGLMAARGRRSASVLDTPAVLAAPRAPYRPGRPYWRRGSRRVVELPIQVTPGIGLPVIGTSIGLAGARAARWIARTLAGDRLVNLELHALDFLEIGDGLAPLAGRQPELRVPLARRMDALSALVCELRGRGRAFVTLEEAARAVA